MSVSFMDDISSIEQRLSVLPLNDLSASHLTKRLYIGGLIDRVKRQQANDKKQLPRNIVNKAHKAVCELEASMFEQKNNAQELLTTFEEEYEYDYAAAKNCFDSESYQALEQLFYAVKYKKNADYFKDLIRDMGCSDVNIALSEDSEKAPSKIKQTELQSFQQYQSMFEKMALDRLLSRVMKEIPENAGPLNPERLVIRSFKALQEISPDYLSQLISYYESLLTLQLFAPART